MTGFLDVAPAQWVSTLRTLRDAGFALFGFLTGIDRGEAVDVVCRVERSDPYEAMAVRTTVPDGTALASIAGLWTGAQWHERETHEMLGVAFSGGDDRPLLLRSAASVPPLRKQAWLDARASRPWPGSAEAGANPSRRRLLPPGVPAEGSR